MADEMNLAPAAGDPRRVPILRVTHDLLPMLGLSPLAGRGFAPSDDVPGGAGRVLISESLWEREFSRSPVGHRRHAAARRRASYRHRRDAARRGLRRAADPVRGRLLALLRRPRRAHRDRDLDGAPRQRRSSCRAAPIPFSWPAGWPPGDQRGCGAGGRRARHVRTREGVSGERRERRARRADRPTWSSGRSGRRSISSLARSRSCCWWRASTSAACCIARGSARAQEVAVRNALGARNSRLVRLFLVESTLMTALATLLGLAIAFGVVRAIVSLAPADVPRLASATVDLRVLAVTIAVSTLAAIALRPLPVAAAGTRRRSVGACAATGRATVSGRREASAAAAGRRRARAGGGAARRVPRC